MSSEKVGVGTDHQCELSERGAMSLNVMALVRMYTKEGVITHYGITPDFEAEFFKECPVAFWSDGKPMFKESDVDEYVRWFRNPPYIYPSRRRGGVRTTDVAIAIADLAVQRRGEGRSWKEIATEVNDRFPGADEVRRSAGSIRKLVGRHNSTNNQT